MLKLIFQRKTFFIALAGICLAIFLVIKFSRNEPSPPPLVPPNQNPFSRSIAASGIVESVGENIRVAPSVSAVVVKVNVEPGERVQKGVVLLEQDDRNLRGQRLVLQAQYEKVQSRFQKVLKLKGSDAISRDEFDTLKGEKETTLAELKRVDLLLDQLKIRAPVEGEILQVNTRVGEFLATPINDTYTPPFLMKKGDGFQIRADVDEFNAHLIKKGAHAKAFRKGAGNRDPIDLEFVRIDPYVIPKKSLTGDNVERVDTRVLQILFKTKNDLQLYTGQQLDLYIEY